LDPLTPGALYAGTRRSVFAIGQEEVPVHVVDLVETAVSNPPAIVPRGGRFTATDTVRNLGALAAGASRTRYYLSKDGNKDDVDLRLTASRFVPRLAGGATSTGTVTVTIPPATAPGTYYLLACADDGGAVQEDNESDNCLASASPLVIQGPDLVTTAVSNPPATASAFASFSVTDTVQNQGTQASRRTTRTRYYLSTDAQRSGNDVQLWGNRAVGGLGAGASSTGTATVHIPFRMAPGTYFLLACADASATLKELDEANNCLASATTVTVGP
jgi:subtilase family serine protease